jgi:hypothetical protein
LIRLRRFARSNVVAVELEIIASVVSPGVEKDILERELDGVWTWRRAITKTGGHRFLLPASVSDTPLFRGIG